MASEIPAILRPLSFGELLDRAVTLFVRNFWLLCGLGAIVYLPLTLVQSFMGDFWLQYLQLMNRILTSGGKAPNVPANTAMIARMNAISLLEIIVWVVAAPLAAAALAHAASRLVTGESTSFRESLQLALQRWGNVLLFGVLWAVLLGVVFVAGYLALVLFGLFAFLVVRSIALGIIFGGIFLLAWLVILVIAVIAGGVGFATLIVEPVNALRAFAAGLERAINRAVVWRSLVVGLLYFAVAFGFSAVAYAAGFGLLFLLHSGIPLMILIGVTSVVQFGFSLLIIVLYYYDLRIRREGTDLATLASHVAAPT